MPRHFKVTVNGREYEVSVLELAPGENAPAPAVVEVHVNVGQTVAPGDRLLVLEAMKMKSPVIATRAGQVTRVLVAPRDAVEGGQVLVTIA